jgi:hypothetical protein
MALPQDPYLNTGPLPPPEPRDPNAGTVLHESERGQDEERENFMNSEMAGQDRPLTDDEKDAAKGDPGERHRTFAPASERVQKPASSGDAELLEAGSHRQRDPEAALHPGDHSDPSELR